MGVNKLDNPTWYALSEVHKTLAIDYDGIKFYKPEYCPFGAFINLSRTKDGINSYAAIVNNFFIVGNKPRFNDKVKLYNKLVCHQMILDKPINFEIKERIIKLETKKHKTDLFTLVNLVQPGYFRSNTSDVGNYYGIYKNNKLVAVTGERMKMHKYTELSAIVTHPQYTGKGYAKQLITYASERVLSEDKTPYLHVSTSNILAIQLYKKMGFITRRKINFWHLVRNEE